MDWRTRTLFGLFLLVLAGCGGQRADKRSSTQQRDGDVAQSSDAGGGEDATGSEKIVSEDRPTASSNPPPAIDEDVPRGIPRDVPSAPGSSFQQPRVARSVAPPSMKYESVDAAADPAGVDDVRNWQEGEKYKTVTVFYGTDRARSYDEMVGLGWQAAHYGVLGIAIVFGLITAVTLTVKSRYRLVLLTASATAVVAVLYVKYVPLHVPMRNFVAEKGILQYGGERGETSLGTCQVTIPRTHKKGEVESPDIRRFEINEDLRKHLVLADVQPLESEAFYQQLRSAVARSPKRDLFIFIHGYNVTFENAARRTAQMAFDLEFEGAPVFYSWPSQGAYLKYPVDLTNISWAVPDVKQFLLDVAKHSGAKSINLIAHSMGNRALTQALRDISLEYRDDPLLFNELILAAPDIDAGQFQRDIAPFIQKTARRTTLYASSRDSALIAAKQLYGGPRAGDGGEHLLLVPGIQTIDASDIEADVLGHSYYASSDLVLSDLKALFDNVGPKLRRWLHEVRRDDLTYWVYHTTRAALTADRRGAEQP